MTRAALLLLILCAPGCVFLRVTSQPPGAEAFVNGISIGPTPAEVTLDTIAVLMPTDIEVKHKGYEVGRARVGWWASWFWIYFTTKTREVELVALPQAEQSEDDIILAEPDQTRARIEDYYAAQRYDEAEALLQRNLELRERQQGPDHPDVVAAVLMLADFYNLRGRYADAVEQYRRALITRESVLGREQAETIAVALELARLHAAFRNHEVAQPLLERVLKAREAEPGLDHDDTLEVVVLLAGVRAGQGDLPDAYALYERAAHVWVPRHGERDARVLAVWSGMAAVCRGLNQLKEAERLEALARRGRR